MQVDLHKGSNTNLDMGVNRYYGTPILNHIDGIYSFAITLIFITAIVVSYKIYARWQAGDEDVITDISRWFFGLLLVFSLLTFLRYFITSQDFGVYQTPSF